MSDEEIDKTGRAFWPSVCSWESFLFAVEVLSRGGVC